MSSQLAQGTTLKFENAGPPPTTVVGDISRIGFNENGNPVDVTDLSDTIRKFLNGITSYECSITVFGVPTQAIGAIGYILIAWNDGGSDTGGNNKFVITGKNRSGGVGEAISTELTFAPYGG